MCYDDGFRSETKSEAFESTNYIPFASTHHSLYHIIRFCFDVFLLGFSFHVYFSSCQLTFIVILTFSFLIQILFLLFESVCRAFKFLFGDMRLFLYFSF